MLNHVLRYEPVAAVLDAQRPGTLLEVGSGSRGVGPYLRCRPRTTACDVSFDDYGSSSTGDGQGTERVTGSVLDLPFADASFDAVIGLDLLEHIAPEDRTRALEELVRVTRTTLVVGCPCGPDAEAGDRRLEAFHHAISRAVPGWLVEHLDHGLPAVAELLAPLEGRGALEAVPNAEVRAHTRVLAAEALPALWRAPFALSVLLRTTLLRPRSRRAARAVVRALRGSDHLPTYRTIAVLRK